MERLKEVLEFLGIPHYPSLAEWDQEEWIAEVQRRRREFRPKKPNGDKLDFSPPSISPKQRKLLDGMDVGTEYARDELPCSISTLRSLARKGLVISDEEEERWRRLETEWI